MNKIIKLLLTFTLISLSLSVYSAEVNTLDKRISLELTESEKISFLTEMRQMLTSIQGILSGIGEENREQIIKAARYSGNRMARETPASIKKKVPQEFRAIGRPTHMMFEELAIRAETDDMATLASFSGELMKQCLHCHQLFKTD